jgi:hypothetical protein
MQNLLIKKLYLAAIPVGTYPMLKKINGYDQRRKKANPS